MSLYYHVSLYVTLQPYTSSCHYITTCFLISLNKPFALRCHYNTIHLPLDVIILPNIPWTVQSVVDILLVTFLCDQCLWASIFCLMLSVSADHLHITYVFNFCYLLIAKTNNNNAVINLLPNCQSQHYVVNRYGPKCSVISWLKVI